MKQNNNVTSLWKQVGAIVVIVALVTLGGLTVWAAENRDVILATTTSVQDTGLLDVLLGTFTKQSGTVVKPIAVGSGQAMELGRRGEADILWVHSPDDELPFVAESNGINRITFMHNDFVLLGPTSDPAKVSGIVGITNVFAKLQSSGCMFVSRGDKSGTHKKELKLWEHSGVVPVKERYLETGQGMAATVRVANEKQAYCLADRSSYLSLRKTLALGVVSEGDMKLRNNYSLILVNPAKFPKANASGAKALYDFLLSKETKDVVESFGKETYGQQLFYYDYGGK